MRCMDSQDYSAACCIYFNAKVSQTSQQTFLTNTTEVQIHSVSKSNPVCDSVQADSGFHDGGHSCSALRDVSSLTVSTQHGAAVGKQQSPQSQQCYDHSHECPATPAPSQALIVCGELFHKPTDFYASFSSLVK